MSLSFWYGSRYYANHIIELRFLTTELMIRFTKLSFDDQKLCAKAIYEQAREHLQPYKDRLAQPPGLSLHIDTPWTEKRRRKINVTLEEPCRRATDNYNLSIVNLGLM